MQQIKKIHSVVFKKNASHTEATTEGRIATQTEGRVEKRVRFSSTFFDRAGNPKNKKPVEPYGKKN